MTTGGVYGGYDYNFVDGDPPSKYICTICTLVACDPQQVTCCYNTFCKSCLGSLARSAQPKKPKCPLCNKSLHFFKDGKLNREIISLKVYCTNSEEGCKWKGTINGTDTSIEAHLNDSCLYQLIPCTNKCGEEVLRMSLHDHIEEECPKRIVECEYCEEEDAHQLITSSSHLDECPAYPVKCSNEECEEKIPRRLLASHTETCPKAVVTCKYNTVGCNKRMKREEKEEHNKESVQEHLQMTKRHLQITNEKLQFAVQQVHSLQLHHPINKVIKVDQCFKKKEKDEIWYSPGFYTSPGGYKMRLRFDSNVESEGKGTYVSCYICFMSGEYDDTLEWPFHGEVTIELLNQLEDKNHKNYTISYNESVPEECKQRVPKGEDDAEGWGTSQFISHSELEYNPITNCQYLKDDSLYFRVSVKVTSKTKPWLAGVQ